MGIFLDLVLFYSMKIERIHWISMSSWWQIQWELMLHLWPPKCLEMQERSTCRNMGPTLYTLPKLPIRITSTLWTTREWFALWRNSFKAWCITNVVFNLKLHLPHRYSQFQTEYTLDEILKSPIVFDPLTKLQCCPTSDGSAAAILVSEDFVHSKGLEGQAVELLGMEMATDFNSTFQGRSMMNMVEDLFVDIS